jgi:phosphatidylglycerol:prolipoprotein diacylglycerol transferase
MTLGEVFTALGYVVGAGVLFWAAKERKLATEGIGWIVLSGFFAGIIGAKLAELLFSGWPVRIPLVFALDPRLGGRALLGGVIFGWIGVEIAKCRLGVRRSTGDLFAIALPAGEAIGRIGCFFNGCCFGTECDLPWAVNQHGAWRHPTQIYSAVTAAAIFLVLVVLRARFPREGDLFRAYLVLFGVTRFALEFLRAHDTVWAGLTPMQWFCAELAIYGSFTLARGRRLAVTHE